MTDDTPPGPRSLPVIGNTIQWARNPCAFQQRCAEQYGSVVSYDILGMDAYMLTDPVAIERILVTEADSFPKHPEQADRLRKIVGDGLIVSTGHLWERQRDTIQPAFHMSQIKRYADIMVNRTKEKLADWTASGSLDMDDEMRHLTLDILIEAMFGRDIDPEARGLYSAVEGVRAPSDPRNLPIAILAPDWAPIPFLRRARKSIDHISDEIYDIIATRRQNNEERDDLLSLLLAADESMSTKQVRDEMVTFLFAGHETTAVALTYIWDLLSRNPEAETQLHDELDTVLGTSPPTIADLPALDYTENIVKEAMRLYPPVPELRRTPTESVTIDGYSIPTESLIVLPIWVMHRDERFWEKPDVFNPARWNATSDRPDFAYFPFGGGKRRCIGQQFARTEAKLIVATIAQQLTFDRLYDELSLIPSVTLRPKGQVEMIALSR
jgi:cytochrome P450